MRFRLASGYVRGKLGVSYRGKYKAGTWGKKHRPEPCEPSVACMLHMCVSTSPCHPPAAPPPCMSMCENYVRTAGTRWAPLSGHYGSAYKVIWLMRRRARFNARRGYTGCVCDPPRRVHVACLGMHVSHHHTHLTMGLATMAAHYYRQPNSASRQGTCRCPPMDRRLRCSLRLVRRRHGHGS